VDLTDSVKTLDTGKAVKPAAVLDGQRCYNFDTCDAPLHLVEINRATAKCHAQHPVAPDYLALGVPKLYVLVIDYRNHLGSSPGKSAYLFTNPKLLLSSFSKYASKSYKIPTTELVEDHNYYACSKLVAEVNPVQPSYSALQSWHPPRLEVTTMQNYCDTFLKMDGTVSYPLFQEFRRLVDKYLVPTKGDWKSKGCCPGPGRVCYPGGVGKKKTWLNNKEMYNLIVRHIDEKGLSPHSSMLPKSGDVNSRGNVRTVYPVSIQSEVLLREHFGVAYRNIYNVAEMNVHVVAGETPDYIACLVRDMHHHSYYYDLTSCETQMLDYVRSYLKFAEHIPPRVKMALMPPIMNDRGQTCRPECYPSGVLYTSFFGTLFTVAIHNVYFPEVDTLISGDGIITDVPVSIPIYVGNLRRTKDFNGFIYDNEGGFRYARAEARLFARRNKSRFINGRTLFLLRHQIYTELYNVKPYNLSVLENQQCGCFGDLGPLNEFRTVGYEIRCVHGNSAWKTGDCVFDAMKLVRYYLDERKNNTNRFLESVDEFFKEIEHSVENQEPDEDTSHYGVSWALIRDRYLDKVDKLKLNPKW